MVKVSIVRMEGKGAGAQRLHLKYIERDSAAPDGETGKLYERSSGEVDSKAFEERGADDRHQFRVIVSPEDGREMESLSAFTKDLMRDMERDLGTKLDGWPLIIMIRDSPTRILLLEARAMIAKILSCLNTILAAA